jgi:hypothetical protein
MVICGEWKGTGEEADLLFNRAVAENVWGKPRNTSRYPVLWQALEPGFSREQVRCVGAFSMFKEQTYRLYEDETLR